MEKFESNQLKKFSEIIVVSMYFPRKRNLSQKYLESEGTKLASAITQPFKKMWSTRKASTQRISWIDGYLRRLQEGTKSVHN